MKQEFYTNAFRFRRVTARCWSMGIKYNKDKSHLGNIAMAKHQSNFFLDSKYIAVEKSNQSMY